MSSLDIYIDTKQPELVGSLIDYYTGSIDVELYPVASAEIESNSSIDIIPNGTWYNWTPCVNWGESLDNKDYFKAMYALSKIQHLITQSVEGNSSGDGFWSVGNSNSDVEKLIKAPLEFIDTEVENQLKEKLKYNSKLHGEIRELYSINRKINTSWKGFILRVLGINLPDNESVTLGGINAKGENTYNNKKLQG